MKRYNGLREKAVEWRIDGLSIDDICSRLCLSKGTVHHWIKHIPLQRPKRINIKPAQAKAASNFKRKRTDAYSLGTKEFDELSTRPTFRDFVLLFMTEGHRRSTHRVEVANMSPALIKLAAHWMRQLSQKPIHLKFFYHSDRSPADLREFWSNATGVPIERISHLEKISSGHLHRRNFVCVYGIAQITVHDTSFRERMRAWSDAIEREWEKLHQPA